jgi:hypothetical protein
MNEDRKRQPKAHNRRANPEKLQAQRDYVGEERRRPGAMVLVINKELN